MDEELKKVIDNMVADGASDEDIDLVVRHYKEKKQSISQPTPSPEPEGNSIMSGLNKAGEYAGGVFRGVGNTLLSDVPKLIGRGSEALGRAVLPESLQHKSFFTDVGEKNKEIINNAFPVSEETQNSIGGQLAQGLGTAGAMFATAGLGELGAAAKGLQMTETAVPTAAKLFGQQLVKPISIVGGAMTAVPEYEAAKAAGKSDDEAFNTLVKNYFVGQTEALPIEGMFHRLNQITGGGIVNNIKKYLGGVVSGGLSEATQEGIQTYLTNRIAESDYDPDRDPFFSLAESMTVGGLVGMIIPGVAGAIKVASPDNKVKLEKKLQDLKAKEESIKQVDSSLLDADTGNPEINKIIDEHASLNKEQLNVIGQKPVSEAAAEEAKEDTEARQKEIDKAEDQLDKHDIAKKKSEDGKGSLLPEQVKELKQTIKGLNADNEVDTNALKDQAIAQLQELSTFDITNATDEDKAIYHGKLQEARNTLEQLKPQNPRKKPNTKEQQEINDATGVTKSEKTIHLTPGEAIKKQITDFYSGVKEGVSKGKNLSNDLLTKVQEYLKGERPRSGETVAAAPFTNQQVSAILTKIKKTNLFTPGSVSRLGDYVDKVAKNADYAHKIGQAETLRSKIKSKRKAGTVMEQHALNEFSKINPDEVDVDTYLQNAADIAQSFRPVTDRKVLNVAKTHEYIASVKPQVEAAAALREAERPQQMADRLGVTLEEAQHLFQEPTAEEENIADANKKKHIRNAFLNLGEEAKSSLVDDVEDANENEKQDLNSIRNADLSLLTTAQLKDYIKTIDRINTNGDFGGSGKLTSILKAAEDFKTLKDKLKDSHIGTLSQWGPVQEADISSIPMIMQAITGLPQQASDFQNFMAMNDVNDAYVQAEEAQEKFVNEIKALDNKGHKGFDDESIFRQAIYGELIRYNEDQNPEEALSKTKEIIEQDIANHITKGKSKEAASISKLYAPFKNATTIDELHDIMHKIDPVGKQIIDKSIELFKPYGDKVADYNNRYHNEKTVKSVNYSGPRVWIKDGSEGVDELPVDKLGNAEGYSSSIPKPKQISTAKQFKNLARTDALLNYNKHQTMNGGIRRTVFGVEGIAPMIRVRENIKRRSELEKIFGAKEGDDKSIENARYLYKTLFGKEGLYTEFENGIAGRVIPKEFDRNVSKFLTPLRKLGYSLTLSGFSQIPKQATVLANVMINLGSDATLLPVRELISNREGAAKFFAGHTINLRGAQKSQFSLGDMTNPGANSDYKKGLSKLVDRGFEGWFGLKPLVVADVGAAKLTYLAFYKQYLKQQGIKYQGVSKEADLAKEPKRKEAHSYAKQRTDTLQGVSNPAEMGRILKDQSTFAQFVKAAIIPFGTFNANTKSRMWSDTKMLLTGNRLQKKAAFRDLVGTATENALFNTTTGAMKLYLWGGFGHLVAGMFNLPDDKKREKKDIDNAVSTWKTKVFFDMLPVILTDPGQSLIAEGINAASDRLLHYKDPLYNPKPFKEDKLDAFLNLTGVYGIAIQRLIDSGKISKQALSETRENSAGKEKKLTDEQIRFASWLGIFHALNMVGAMPSDVVFALDKEFNATKPGKHAKH